MTKIRATLTLENHWPDAPYLFLFKTPAVRHLAWLCQAPQLVQHASVFDPKAYLPADLMTTLQQWDNNPDTRPELLNKQPHYRLGYYVETLYTCLLQDVLGWTILARNLPIRIDGTTLGELDFLALNTHTGQVEHHEIAIKFYLGYDGCEARPELPAGWYGPNPRDRLDIKTTRLLGPQSQRGLLPETSDVLAQHGIAPPDVSRVFMPGYLFYPRTPTPTRCTALLDSVPSNHLRGQWMYLDQIAEINTQHWVPLIKPHWLGPWIQTQAPDNTDVKAALADITDTQTPRLFAVLEHDLTNGLWTETGRVFVVPAHWPQ